MTDWPMLPLERFKVVSSADAAGGALLFGPGANVASAMLMIEGPKQEAMGPFRLRLGSGEGAFVAGPAPKGSYLSVDGWRVIVDIGSAFTSTTDAAQAGDAFLRGSRLGFCGRWVSRASAYVTLDGAALSEDWSEFVGFKRWAIVLDIPGQVEPVTLFERSR